MRIWRLNNADNNNRASLRLLLFPSARTERRALRPGGRARSTWQEIMQRGQNTLNPTCYTPALINLCTAKARGLRELPSILVPLLSTILSETNEVHVL